MIFSLFLLIWSSLKMGFSSPKNRFNGVLYKVYIFIQYLLNLTFGKSVKCKTRLKMCRSSREPPVITKPLITARYFNRNVCVYISLNNILDKVLYYLSTEHNWNTCEFSRQLMFPLASIKSKFSFYLTPTEREVCNVSNIGF